MKFSQALLSWYDREGRALPWRETRDPYRVWLSEIMLQQTRAEAVVPRYEAFLARFPDVRALAAAGEQDVLKAWEGMGYYSRARNLRRAAVILARAGGFPRTAAELECLPGVGPYTAGAIASIAFGEPVPALDGNQARVLARVLAYGEPLASPHKLRPQALALLDRERPGDYNQALMDLGSGICTPRRPRCENCPVGAFCLAFAEGEAQSYPRLPAPVARREICLTVLLAFYRGRVLVRRRAEKGLLGGLWEFPSFEESAQTRALPGFKEGAQTRALPGFDESAQTQGLPGFKEGAQTRALPGFDESAQTQGLPGFKEGAQTRALPGFDEGALAKTLPGARAVEALPAARHVFTHLIWNMRGLRAQIDAVPAGMRAVDRAGLAALPFPTALRVYREIALKLLEA